MFSLSTLIFVAGVLHFGILTASACVPFVLNWREELGKLDGLFRQLVWIYGGYIVMMIVGFGIISMALPGELASGSPLGRAVAGLIAVFWGVRLGLQLFVLDARAFLTRWHWRLGYHALTVAFVFHTIVYSVAAIS